MRLTAVPRTFVGICIGVLIASMLDSALAVNGIAISVRCPVRTKTEGDMFGSINRLDIVNNRVAKDTTIWDAASGFVRMPRISQDGKRICFFRDGDKWVNSQIVAGTPDYISVIDIDGRNLRDVLTLSGALATNRYDGIGGNDRKLEWPAGEWVYYHKPTTLEIWRVNVTTLANELVTTMKSGVNGGNYIGRFNMTADGSRACQNGKSCSFPGMTACASDGSFGCNHCISASGRFGSGWLINTGTFVWPASYRYVGDGTAPSPYQSPYNGRLLIHGGHAYFEFLDWNLTTNKRTNFGLSLNDCYNYRHLSYMLGTKWLQETIGTPMVGADSHCPRFSCNSDKWICHSPGRNQILWNWVDREVILGSRNKVGSMGASESGEFWVQPPDASYAGTRYEDISGAWLPFGTWSTTPLPDYVTGPGCANPYEASLKYGNLVIMPQTVYDTIAKGQPVTGEEWMANAYAVVIPDISTLVVKAGSSMQVTVTNQNYDPVDPIFGKPPAPPSWRIIGTGASISPVSGLSPTITTTSAFSACSVEVSMTVGAITRAVRKLVSTNAPVLARDAGDKGSTLRIPGTRITPLPGGAVRVELLDCGVQSIDVYRVDGTRVFEVAGGFGSVTIPARVFSPGMHLFRLNRGQGGTVCLRWMAR